MKASLDRYHQASGSTAINVSNACHSGLRLDRHTMPYPTLSMAQMAHTSILNHTFHHGHHHQPPGNFLKMTRWI
jgi:uncharacterized damage-inducible protein DinB